METTPKLAIVVLSYNGKELLKQFLPGIIKTCPDYGEVWVVDNASTDGTSEFLKEAFPSVKTLRLLVNKGFTNGYYESLPQIKAEYYVLISSDVEVSEGWVEPIISLMDADKTIGLCQPKVKSWHEKNKFEYSGAGGAFMDIYGYPFCRGRIFFDVEEDTGQYDDVIEVMWCSGACMFIRADVYHYLGGFENDFYAHMEDIDLSWRAKSAGYKVMVCPQSVVYHMGGHIITYGSPQKIFRNYRNGMILLLKNLPSSQVWWVIPVRLVLDGIAGFKALVSGNGKETLAILKAHGQFWGNFGKWVKKRRDAKKQVISQPNRTGFYNGSILVKYFLKGKKKFSQLPKFKV